MAIDIILFGQLVDLAGTSQLQLEAADTNSLQAQLHDRVPALAGTTYRIAVNKNIVTQNTPLPEGASVALLPPFSGG